MVIAIHEIHVGPWGIIHYLLLGISNNIILFVSDFMCIFQGKAIIIYLRRYSCLSNNRMGLAMDWL